MSKWKTLMQTSILFHLSEKLFSDSEAAIIVCYLISSNFSDLIFPDALNRYQ